MRLTAALQGDLRQLLAAELKEAERGVTTGVRRATDGLKAELRGQVTGAGLGERLARSWRSATYPRAGTSLTPAGLVWSKAPRIVRAFAYGALIRSRGGLFLAIPTEAAGRVGDGRKRITPGSWERRTGLRLRFVYRSRAPSLLVADNVRLTGRGRAARNEGRRGEAGFTPLAGRTTVPIFVLVPQVTLKKRLDVEAAGRKWVARLPALTLAACPGERR
ncbi:MAG: DUF6441 family protein [Geminicoccaceae bacterium]